jgi:hypothetical protein
VGAARGADLRVEPDASVDRGDLEAAGDRKRPRVVDDLGGELARRRQHQRGRARLAASEPVEQRDRERERLARAGRRLRQHVAAGEDVGDHEPLNRERPGDSMSGEGVDHGR